MKEVYEFLKKCGTYYLATVEGDQPRVRPFGTIDVFEDRQVRLRKFQSRFRLIQRLRSVHLQRASG